MMLRREKTEDGMDALHLLQCKMADRLTLQGVSGMKTHMKRAIDISIIICG